MSKLIGKSIFYKIPYLIPDVGGQMLAERLGRSGFLAAVAILDGGFAVELRNSCKRRESSDEEDGSPSGESGV